MTRKSPVVRLGAVRGATLELRKAERRERLVAAGLALFGVHGYHAVTVRDVCAEAKLTERYFYESFTNLDALFVATFEHVNRPLRQRTIAALVASERQPLSFARAALDVYARYMEADPRVARILLFESVAVGGEVFRFASQSTEEYVDLLRSFLEAIAPEGLPKVRTNYIASALIGAHVYAVMRWYREGFATPAEEVVESVFALYRGLDELNRVENGPTTSVGAERAAAALARGDMTIPSESAGNEAQEVIGKASRAR